MADVLISGKLLPEQCIRVDTLLEEYSGVFSDRLSITNVACHEIWLTSNLPIRMKPYPISVKLVDAVRKEVNDILLQP